MAEVSSFYRRRRISWPCILLLCEMCIRDSGYPSRKKEVTVKNLETGEEFEESYDKLILSPGAKPTPVSYTHLQAGQPAGV